MKIYLCVHACTQFIRPYGKYVTYDERSVPYVYNNRNYIVYTRMY